MSQEYSINTLHKGDDDDDDDNDNDNNNNNNNIKCKYEHTHNTFIISKRGEALRFT